MTPCRFPGRPCSSPAPAAVSGWRSPRRAAADGANIALIAKTAEPHPKLEGTVYTAAKEIEEAGGQALPIVGDIRDGDSVAAAVAQAVEQFGGIDICVNNASAINLGSITEVPLKRFDLMNGIQVRGTYAVSQACIPHMKGRDNPHILTLSPPIRLESEWLKPTAYMMAKFGMTLCALGIAEELRDDGIASNTLWPRTLVATAAVQNLLGGDEAMGRARKPDVYADAAYVILNKPAREYTGNTLLCEDVLLESGVTDLSVYDCVPGADLGVDLWVDTPTRRATPDPDHRVRGFAHGPTAAEPAHARPVRYNAREARPPRGTAPAAGRGRSRSSSSSRISAARSGHGPCSLGTHHVRPALRVCAPQRAVSHTSSGVGATSSPIRTLSVLRRPRWGQRRTLS